MRFRHFAHSCAVGAMLALTALSTPALAHGHKDHPGERPGGRDMRPEWRGDRHDGHVGDYGRGGGFDPRAREDWLDDCRERISYQRRDSGVGGALIGGAAGGLLGHRIAGRGNRTVGTIAGAAVGAVAGAAIDRAEDRGRDRDECETYLDDYYARYTGGGYAQPGYGYPAYGYAVPMVMVPVMMQQKPCVETVTTTEYVTQPARRYIRRAPRPDKRIRIAPDKRIPLK